MVESLPDRIYVMSIANTLFLFSQIEIEDG